MEKEHLAHSGVVSLGASVSQAFGTMELSRILFLITLIGSATKVVIEGGGVVTNRSATSRNASAYMLFIWICASGYIGCLVNTKGIDVISSKSAMVLGLIAADPRPSPPVLRLLVLGVAGVMPVSASGGGVGIVTCMTLSKK